MMDQPNTGFTFVDLFAGIGGFRTGFESVGGRCVYTSEWNKYCRRTYEANFDPVHSIAGDITKVPVEEVPSHDVLLAGFPCQPFSLAGVPKRNSLDMPHGFECPTQGTLFFEVKRIIRHHRPQAFVLENVKNLLSHNKGATFEVIRRILEEELEYHVHWRVLDASHWVPQHRERVFIVGLRDRDDFTFDGLLESSVGEPPKLSSVLHPENGSEAPEPPYTEGLLATVASKYTLSPGLWAWHQSHAKKHRSRGNGFGYGLFGPDDVARTISSRYHKDGAEALIRQPGGKPRRLTPRECARLMGFEQPSGSEFVIPVSDTQAYQQFGNAVVVPVVKALAAQLVPYLMPAVTNFAKVHHTGSSALTGIA